MGWPQIVIIVLMILVGLKAAVKHGESKGSWDVSATVASIFIEAWILWMGGFFK